jgi:hypothetical protein
MFRLAKVNSDNERSIAETLQVSGLPTVFSVANGKFTDRFVGMLPQEQLQQYLVRAVTGYGARVQGAELTEQDLIDATTRMGSVAGLAAISFKAREKLRTMVDEAMDLPGGLTTVESDSGKVAMSAGVKTALAYINNAAKSVRDPRFRVVNTSAPAYRERVAGCPAAVKLLEVAGFKAPNANATANANATSAGDGAGAGASAGEASLDEQPTSSPSPQSQATALSLVHSNTAVLTLVAQRAAEYAQKHKFSAIRQSTVDMDQNKSFRKKRSSAAASGATNKDTEQAKATSASAPVPVPVPVPVAATSSKAPAVSVSSLSKPKTKSPNTASKAKAKSQSKGSKGGGTHTLFSEGKARDTVELFGGTRQ